MTYTRLTRCIAPILTALTLSVTSMAKETEKFQSTYPLDADGVIALDNINGSVEIIAWDKPEVSLEAEKSANTAEGLARIHLQIESSPQRLTVRTEYEKKWKFWDNMKAQVKYKLMVPAGVSLEKIDVVNSSIQVTGVQGRVRLEAVNGSVEAEGLSGPCDVETVNGKIRLSYASFADNPEIDIDTVNGSATLVLPAAAAFRLDASTINGGVSCDFPVTLEKSGKHSLRGSVNGGGSRVKLEAVNGGLHVKQEK